MTDFNVDENPLHVYEVTFLTGRVFRFYNDNLVLARYHAEHLARDWDTEIVRLRYIGRTRDGARA